MKLGFKILSEENYTDNLFGEFINTLTGAKFDVVLFFREHCFIIREIEENHHQFIFAKTINKDLIDSSNVREIYTGHIDCYKNIGYEFMKRIRETKEYPDLEMYDFPFSEVEIFYCDQFENYFHDEGK